MHERTWNARRARRNLCPATYLATLFTGQEAVCPALPFCDIIADFYASARASAQSWRSFFAGLLCSIVRNSHDVFSTSVDIRPTRSGPRVQSQRRPFFTRTLSRRPPFLRDKRGSPLPRDRVAAFTVVRPSIVSPFLRPLPGNCDRRKYKRSSILIVNRSFLFLLPAHPSLFPASSRKGKTVAIRSPVNNVRPSARNQYDYFWERSANRNTFDYTAPNWCLNDAPDIAPFAI